MSNSDKDMYTTLVSLLVRLKEENIDLLDFYTNMDTNEKYIGIVNSYLYIGMSDADKQEFINAIKIAVQSAHETLKMLKV